MNNATIIHDNREVKSLIVDSKTGEIITELKTGDRIFLKNVYENIVAKNKSVNPDDIEYYYLDYHDFIKINAACQKKLINIKLTLTDWRLLMFLTTMVHYNNNFISYCNGHTVTKEFIKKELNLTKRQIDDSLRSLKLNGIIASNGIANKTRYYLNPHIICQGRYTNKTILSMFKNTKWAKISGLKFK